MPKDLPCKTARQARASAPAPYLAQSSALNRTNSPSPRRNLAPPDRARAVLKDLPAQNRSPSPRFSACAISRAEFRAQPHQLAQSRAQPRAARPRAPAPRANAERPSRAKPRAKPALQRLRHIPRRVSRAQPHQLAQSRDATSHRQTARTRAPSQCRKTFPRKTARQARASAPAPYLAQNFTRPTAPRRANPCRASRGHIARGRYVYIIAHIARKCET